ncbi:MAG: hypothetical protein Hals2KO_15260 [Halioglobus sp.]
MNEKGSEQNGLRRYVLYPMASQASLKSGEQERAQTADTAMLNPLFVNYFFSMI